MLSFQFSHASVSCGTAFGIRSCLDFRVEFNFYLSFFWHLRKGILLVQFSQALSNVYVGWAYSILHPFLAYLASTGSVILQLARRIEMLCVLILFPFCQSLFHTLVLTLAFLLPQFSYLGKQVSFLICSPGTVNPYLDSPIIVSCSFLIDSRDLGPSLDIKTSVGSFFLPFWKSGSHSFKVVTFPVAQLEEQSDFLGLASYG